MGDEGGAEEKNDVEYGGHANASEEYRREIKVVRILLLYKGGVQTALHKNVCKSDENGD